MPIFLGITVAASLLDWMGIIARLAVWIEPPMALFQLPREAAVAVIFACIRKDAILMLSNDLSRSGFDNYVREIGVVCVGADRAAGGGCVGV
jgi:hypothetical protein